jgi:dTDP-4-amino-4,6-dideoxygalactose transaminase
MTTATSVPLIDLRAQYLALKEEIDVAVARVLDSGWYILGREVVAFEQEFAEYYRMHGGGDVECVALNSGTDALHLALRACGVGPGDEVITVSHTAVATVAAIGLTGATPVFVDVDPCSYTLNPATLAGALSPRTRAILPVHLYGHPADMDAILEIASRAGVYVVEDCAQAHGATDRGRLVGSMGDIGCYSFYPTKNLGALGDGGAVVSRRPELAAQVRLLREYGWTPQSRYVSQIQGTNSRLDEMQAAILCVKLRYLDEWNVMRRKLAALYTDLLPAAIRMPPPSPNADPVYHLYVVRVPHRDQTRLRLQAVGIGTGIHYPVPVHLQPAYQQVGRAGSDLRQTEKLALEILSLPLYPQLAPEQVHQVAAVLADAVRDA